MKRDKPLAKIHFINFSVFLNIKKCHFFTFANFSNHLPETTKNPYLRHLYKINPTL